MMRVGMACPLESSSQSSLAVYEGLVLRQHERLYFQEREGAVPEFVFIAVVLSACLPFLLFSSTYLYPRRRNRVNPSGVKRSWQQVKVKYKNMVQTAKKAERRKSREGPLQPCFSAADELMDETQKFCSTIDSITGETSSTELDSTLSHSNFVRVLANHMTSEEAAAESGSEVSLNNVPVIYIDNAEEMTSGSSIHEDPSINETIPEAVPSTSQTRDRQEDKSRKPSSVNVKELYMKYLQQEIDYRKLKMQKMSLEMKLLEKQLNS
ncbi:uncharacterized protein LOC109615974 [Esox lucius]|uniref:uncharacterized protein LOC109615974 n=1 Tax=Esox lucius TaxID=8010 RepID=UPI001476C8B7|nr:uncharacterized protein LOC109615974 [Esox lucius]